MEGNPVSAPKIRKIRWVVKEWATCSISNYWEVIQAQCRTRRQLHRGWKVLSYHNVQDIGSSVKDIGSSGRSVWIVGWGVRSKDQKVFVGIIMYEFLRFVLWRQFQPTCCVQVADQQTRNSPSKHAARFPRSVGANAKSKPHGFSPVCRPTWLEWQ